MYAVAASPLAKQTRTGVGAGEMNTEYRQKQVRQDCSAICGLRQCLSKGLLAPEKSLRGEKKQQANNNNNLTYKHKNNNNLKIFF